MKNTSRIKDSALRQTTFRINPELLRELRFILDTQGLSVAQFLVQKIEEHVTENKDVIRKAGRQETVTA